MRQISLLIVLAAFLSLNVACNQPTKKSETETSQPPVSTTKIGEQKSLEYHNKLMSSFNPNWETEEPAPSDYPTYYGGSFIDNNGKFVVCIVGNPAQYRSTIAAVIGSDDFVTESCKYSYREMMQIMDKIDAFLSNSSIPVDHPFLSRFAGAGADVFENRVVVQLTEVTDEAIQAFKKDISSSPAVVFEKGEMPSLM